MNANDNIKNDFIFFQNEVLSDIKKLESKLTEKIFQMNNAIEQNNLKTLGTSRRAIKNDSYWMFFFYVGISAQQLRKNVGF